jgi:pilus assembly protein CpaB
MNRRLISILLTAFVIAAGCAFMVNRVVASKAAGAQRPATTRVVAAATDIKLGTVLAAKDLTTIEIAGTVPKGAILATDKAIGRGVISNLYEGEPILDNRLAAMGSGGGLAATIRQGMRACAVKVDEVVGVAGFVTPGMRVDVLISGTAPGGVNVTEGTKVKTLLQNIEVLSAGTDIQKDQEGKPQQVQVVNLLVLPEQAEALSLASNQAKIQLVLRNPLDTQISKTSGTAMGNLFADTASAPVKVRPAKTAIASKPAAQAFSIQVLNGSKSTDAKFVSSEAKQ